MQVTAVRVVWFVVLKDVVVVTVDQPTSFAIDQNEPDAPYDFMLVRKE